MRKAIAIAVIGFLFMVAALYSAANYNAALKVRNAALGRGSMVPYDADYRWRKEVGDPAGGNALLFGIGAVMLLLGVGWTCEAFARRNRRPSYEGRPATGGFPVRLTSEPPPPLDAEKAVPVIPRKELRWAPPHSARRGHDLPKG